MMLYAGHEDELRGLLGPPDDALTMGLLPLGYPAQGRWAQPKRRPVEEVVHWSPPPQLTIRSGHGGARRGPRGWTLCGHRRA